MNTLVSIITVSYNSEKTISKTISSVLNQSYKYIEYIIIDGLSHDSTVQIAYQYDNAFKEKGIAYRIISEKDNGIYDAMNKGINIASGQIIGLINSDDWYELDAIEKVVSIYDSEKFDLFYADLRICKKSGNVIKKAKNKKWLTTRHWNHPTTFIASSIYKKIQYKCETIYDDWDLILKVKNSGAKVSVLNDVLANFNFGGISNTKNFKKVWERVKIKYKIYRENGYPFIFWLDCFFMEFIKYVLA